MTRIDFYILKKNAPNAHVDFICRLAEKIYRQNRQILLHTDDAKQAGMMDDLLWTWRQNSFIPHEHLSGEVTDCPILINHNPDIDTPMSDVLINMARTVPLFFSQFERVTEIVAGDEETRQQARQRYRFYQERGYPLASHDIT